MFTEVNVNTLVSWLAATIVFLFSGSHMMGWRFRKYYRWLSSRKITWLPGMSIYGLVWVIIAACFVSSMTLYTMFYEWCNNTYYIVIIVMALTTLVMLSAWAPFMVRMGSARMALVSNIIACSAAITAAILMGLSVIGDTSDGCRPGDRGAGIAALILWVIPIPWYIFATIITFFIVKEGHDAQYKAWKLRGAKEDDEFYGSSSRHHHHKYKFSEKEMQLPLVHNTHLK